MTPSAEHFPAVTLLITHYNRPASLRRLLARFADLSITFANVVVSDDGSRTEHQPMLRELKQQFDCQLISTPKNRGLGHNINKGQDAVQTPYTLYVQEDFVPKPAFALHFADALTLMNQDPTLDLARFYAYFAYPYTSPLRHGFVEMVYKPMLWHADHLKFYVYSDHPHLRRSSFFQKFGRYAEGINVDKTEFQMCLSFIKNGGKGIFFTRFSDLFDQVNTTDEPSTADYRADRKYDNWAFLTLRRVYLLYRLTKNTIELATFRRGA
jgi:glycosyltransferase involved in cell wall biosynthesis